MEPSSLRVGGLACKCFCDDTDAAAGKYNVFETSLEVLRVKGRHPGVAPSELMDLDADILRFMKCLEEWPAGELQGRVYFSVYNTTLWRNHRANWGGLQEAITGPIGTKPRFAFSQWPMW